MELLVTMEECLTWIIRHEVNFNLGISRYVDRILHHASRPRSRDIDELEAVAV
jgi:hypothetical protein